jgi:hypothetical protein
LLSLKLNAGSLSQHNFQLIFYCLLMQQLSQLKTTDAIGEARVVINLLRIYYLTTHQPPFHKQAIEPGP